MLLMSPTQIAHLQNVFFEIANKHPLIVYAAQVEIYYVPVS